MRSQVRAPGQNCGLGCQPVPPSTIEIAVVGMKTQLGAGKRLKATCTRSVQVGGLGTAPVPRPRRTGPLRRRRPAGRRPGRHPGLWLRRRSCAGTCAHCWPRGSGPPPAPRLPPATAAPHPPAAQPPAPTTPRSLPGAVFERLAHQPASPRVICARKVQAWAELHPALVSGAQQPVGGVSPQGRLGQRPCRVAAAVPGCAARLKSSRLTCQVLAEDGRLARIQVGDVGGDARRARPGGPLPRPSRRGSSHLGCMLQEAQVSDSRLHVLDAAGDLSCRRRSMSQQPAFRCCRRRMPPVERQHPTRWISLAVHLLYLGVCRSGGGQREPQSVPFHGPFSTPELHPRINVLHTVAGPVPRLLR